MGGRGGRGRQGRPIHSKPSQDSERIGNQPCKSNGSEKDGIALERRGTPEGPAHLNHCLSGTWGAHVECYDLAIDKDRKVDRLCVRCRGARDNATANTSALIGHADYRWREVAGRKSGEYIDRRGRDRAWNRIVTWGPAMVTA